jgi:hypothetical protein
LSRIKLTKRQKSQQNYHVQTNHQSAPLRSSDLSQEKRRSDGQAAGSKAAKNSSKQHEPIDARGKDLHENPDGPDADSQLVSPQTPDSIIEEDGDERAECGAQDTEGRDVRFSVCEGGCTAFPLRFAQIEVFDERCEFGACRKSALVVA